MLKDCTGHTEVRGSGSLAQETSGAGQSVEETKDIEN